MPWTSSSLQWFLIAETSSFNINHSVHLSNKTSIFLEQHPVWKQKCGIVDAEKWNCCYFIHTKWYGERETGCDTEVCDQNVCQKIGIYEYSHPHRCISLGSCRLLQYKYTYICIYIYVYIYRSAIILKNYCEWARKWHLGFHFKFRWKSKI